MYSYEERMRAVELYIKLGKRCCHINSTSLQVCVPISHQETLAAIFHASSASSRW
jgi:hypothetical protein